MYGNAPHQLTLYVLASDIHQQKEWVDALRECEGWRGEGRGGVGKEQRSGGRGGGRGRIGMRGKGGSVECYNECKEDVLVVNLKCEGEVITCFGATSLECAIDAYTMTLLMTL